MEDHKLQECYDRLDELREARTLTKENFASLFAEAAHAAGKDEHLLEGFYLIGRMCRVTG